MIPKAESITVTTRVDVPRAQAFAIFTEELDLWWKRSPRYRFDGVREGKLELEPRAGGRLLEVHDRAAGDVLEVARVRVWEPSSRFVLEWLALAPLVPSPAAAHGEASTELEVRFEDEAGGTRVTLEHRGFERLPRQHPGRYGLAGKAMLDVHRARWGEQVLAFGFYVQAQKPKREL
jgi:uncharacterized protein YndB with AHSA1/START domain